jgi:hypothetical protein
MPICASLLASGSIPLVLQAVNDIAGAPQGPYWDGGLIDYHLHLPYQRDEGLVLYPHFSDSYRAGWIKACHGGVRAMPRWKM